MRIIVKEEGYESPRVKVIEVEVEKGFALSYGGADGNEENM